MPTGEMLGLAAPAPKPAPPPPPPPSTLQAVQRWTDNHRALTAAALGFITTGSIAAYVYAQSVQPKRKRRAPRSRGGTRTDVVVVVGAAARPLVSAVYLDLERRGFLVYVMTTDDAGNRYVRSHDREFLLPLWSGDLGEHEYVEEADYHSRLRAELEGRIPAFGASEPRPLHFAGLVIVPDTDGDPPCTIEHHSPQRWRDALRFRLAQPIMITQSFGPLLAAYHAKLLLLTPSIIPSLRPPGHALQTILYTALESHLHFTAADLAPHGVFTTHFKLGTIDIPALTAAAQHRGSAAPPAGTIAGTPVRDLHHAVFDALVTTRALRTCYVGRGSRAYDYVGRWVPAEALRWLWRVAQGSSSTCGGTEGGDMGDGGSDAEGGVRSLTWEKVEREGEGG